MGEADDFEETTLDTLKRRGFNASAEVSAGIREIAHRVASENGPWSPDRRAEANGSFLKLANRLIQIAESSGRKDLVIGSDLREALRRCGIIFICAPPAQHQGGATIG